MAVYLASDMPLHLIPWSDNDPGFNVVELHDEETAVKRHFSKPYAYYIGAHTGCSCGFSEAPDEGPEASLNSRKTFVTYVNKAIENGSLELFVCWEGDWEKEPEQRLSLRPEDLMETDKWHHELIYAKISKETI
jgi:hypothetical protein